MPSSIVSNTIRDLSSLKMIRFSIRQILVMIALSFFASLFFDKFNLLNVGITLIYIAVSFSFTFLSKIRHKKRVWLWITLMTLMIMHGSAILYFPEISGKMSTPLAILIVFVDIVFNIFVISIVEQFVSGGGSLKRDAAD